MITIQKKYNKHTSKDLKHYAELETFDTFYEAYIEFKKYIDDILNILNFNKESDS